MLSIEIQNYAELGCAKSITAHFNENITVEEALFRIARKGDVFIDSIQKYSLLLPRQPDGIILKKNKLLRDYGLMDKVCQQKRLKLKSDRTP